MISEDSPRACWFFALRGLVAGSRGRADLGEGDSGRPLYKVAWDFQTPSLVLMRLGRICRAFLPFSSVWAFSCTSWGVIRYRCHSVELAAAVQNKISVSWPGVWHHRAVCLWIWPPTCRAIRSTNKRCPAFTFSRRLCSPSPASSGFPWIYWSSSRSLRTRMYCGRPTTSCSST